MGGVEIREVRQSKVLEFATIHKQTIEDIQFSIEGRSTIAFREFSFETSALI